MSKEPEVITQAVSLDAVIEGYMRSIQPPEGKILLGGQHFFDPEKKVVTVQVSIADAPVTPTPQEHVPEMPADAPE